MDLSVFDSLKLLPGISDKTFNHLKRLLTKKTRIVDLLLHKPLGILERRQVDRLSEIRPGDIITIPVKIIEHQSSLRKNSPYKVICKVADGELTLMFFHGNKYYLSRMLPVNGNKIVSGKVDKLNTMTHPDYIVDHYSEVRNIEPIYPLTRGINNRMLINFITQALKYLPNMTEWIDQDLLNKHQWKSLQETIINLHYPKNKYDLVCNTERLAYDEFFAYQLQLQITRYNNQQQKNKKINGNGLLCQYLSEKLPFKLTTGQKKVINEIAGDQNNIKRMIRLLQGDVGSGKTVVALFAMLNAVECGMQTTLMVPTETLAMQHAHWIESLIGDKMRVGLLTGKSKGKRQIKKELEDGTIKILVGTHALFQDKVIFHNMGLAVIDEQHRFGVEQRNRLVNKGDNVDLLLMSATPIPRTLNLTLYGDVDCSILREKPQSRLPIITSLIKKDNLEKVIGSITNALKNNAKIYWICPLIEKSEKMDLVAAIHRFDCLSSIFKEQVGIVHGQMKSQERQNIMLNFKDGLIKILVATTVVEVGIDIIDANIMVIENAERFGLSQLHQLRGRVGRGDKQSYCILLYNNSSQMTYQRLKTIRDSNDGFYIAEQDFKIRGGGDIIGYKQSGLPNFNFIDLQSDNETIPISNIVLQSQNIIRLDPELENRKELNTLLNIFSYQKNCQ